MFVVQMRNTSEKSVTLFKNCKVEILRDYEKEDCYSIISNDNYLAIESFNFNEFRDSTLNSISLKTIIFSEITIHENASTYVRLNIVIEAYLDV